MTSNDNAHTEKRFKTVFLFGAGASYGAGGVKPSAPPLMSDLYDELAACYPQAWGSLSMDIQASFRQHFEQTMGWLWQSQIDSCSVVPNLMRHMGLFFLRYQLSESARNSYVRLLNALQHDGVLGSCVFSTLNYECLLEEAMAQAGLRVSLWDCTWPEDAVPVWKIHGSCNFLPDEKQVSASRKAVRYGTKVVFDPRICFAERAAACRYLLGGTALYPAMAAITPGKPVQIGKSTIEMLQAWWQEAVRGASNVVVIGVRPHPPDKHIWDPLRATPARLLYVGGHVDFESWASKYRPDLESAWIGERFQDSIDGIISRL